MLRLNGAPFCSSAARYQDEPPASIYGTSAKIYARLAFPALADAKMFALVDTGAAYSGLDPEIAERLGLFTREGVPLDRYNVRGTDLAGRLVRENVTLVADTGPSVTFEATFFVSRDWPPGFIVIGYNAFLSSLRFAVDGHSNQWYFGIP